MHRFLPGCPRQCFGEILSQAKPCVDLPSVFAVYAANAL